MTTTITLERWDNVTKYIRFCTIACLGLIFFYKNYPVSIVFSAELGSTEESRNLGLFDLDFLQEAEIEGDASETTSEEEPLTDNIAVDEESENPFLPLIQALENLKQLEKYQVTYSMTNLDNGEKVAEAEIIGNQLTGDMLGILDFYFPEAHPNHYQYDFISYRNFDLAYIQRFKFIESMAFFQQPQFPVGVADQLAQYFDYYVSIDNEELNRVDLRKRQLESLLMLPDMRRLLQVNTERLYEIDGLYIVSLERLQIPEFLFSRSDNFSFDYELGLNIQPIEDGTLFSTAIDVNSTQRFEVSENSNSLNFSVKTESELSNDMMKDLEVEQNVPTPNFSRSLALDNNVMLEKLTKVTLVYNEKTQSYRIRLIGIVENIEFNFFTPDAAGLETTEFMLEYEIKPTNREVPDLSDIKTISSREADYILEEIMHQATQP